MPDDEEPPGAGVDEGLEVVGAGDDESGEVVEGAEAGALVVSSFLSQAVSATAITEARIKVLPIILRLLIVDNVAAPNWLVRFLLGETSGQATGNNARPTCES